MMALSQLGLLSQFVGMLTDSRSFYLTQDMNTLEEYYVTTFRWFSRKWRIPSRYGYTRRNNRKHML